jgi:EmrB/QacA subfamily drug resistance transporter
MTDAGRSPFPTSPARSAPESRILTTVVVVQLLASLDLSLVNLAIPAIRDALELRDAALSWVVAVYMLGYGGFLLFGGRLGDLRGRRRILMIGLAVFAAGSIVGGLAPEGGTLIAGRALQGLGAAAAAPAALALVTAYVPEGPRRARALGLWATSTVAGGAIGVVLSGILTATVGWRAVLLINVPIVAVAVLCALRLPADTASARQPLDVAGAATVTTGTALLVFGLGSAQDRGWGSPVTLACLAVAACALAAFIMVERRTEVPLLRLGLFAHRAVLAANVFGFLITAGQLAAFYFVSLHVQDVLGYPPVSAGLAFLPFCLGSVLGMGLATRLLGRFGPRAILVGGGVAGAAGIAWFGLGGPGGTFLGDILGPSLVASVGIGMSFVAMGSAATTGVPAAEAGMVSGTLNSFRLVGGAAGLAALGTLAATVRSAQRPAGTVSEIAAASAGYRAALLASAVAILLGSLFCLIIPSQHAEATQ